MLKLSTGLEDQHMARVSGKAKVKPGRGKLRGRHCVEVETGKRAKGFKGKGSTKRFMGCYISKADANKAASRYSR